MMLCSCEEVEQTCKQSEQDSRAFGDTMLRSKLLHLTLETTAAPNFSPRTTRTSSTNAIIA
jgi:hypothetical protein